MEEEKSEEKALRKKVLVVDDEYINRQLLGNIISREYEVLYAENGKEALDVMREHRRDLSLVMLDLIMPEMDGTQLLEFIQKDKTLSAIPVIVLTADKSAEVESLKLGASDFIAKPYDMPEVILARVKRIIELAENRQIVQAIEKDALTRLYTPRFFFDYARQMEALNPEEEMDAIVLDIERFHEVNVVYGRKYGDRILKRVAEMLQMILTLEKGLACRAGVDRFYLYCGKRDDHASFLNEILQGVPELRENQWTSLRMGVCPAGYRDLSMEDRFGRAGYACDSLRRKEGLLVAVFDDALLQGKERADKLKEGLRYAIDEGQMAVEYQPRFDISGIEPQVCGAEALVRWQHPELGRLLPDEFLPLIERRDFRLQLDHFVWNEAARQLKDWKDRFRISFPMTVNLSRASAYDISVDRELTAILSEYGLKPADFILDISEGSYRVISTQVAEELKELRDMGFGIEMDDFGAALAPIHTLLQIPAKNVKLDARILFEEFSPDQSLRFVKISSEQARFLSAGMVAECVEKEEQYRLLKQEGVQCMQGYYFGRPGGAEEIEKLL